MTMMTKRSSHCCFLSNQIRFLDCHCLTPSHFETQLPDCVVDDGDDGVTVEEADVGDVVRDVQDVVVAAVASW